MKRLVGYLAAALVGAALLALAGLLTAPEGADPSGDAEHVAAGTWTAPDRSFTITSPSGWKTVAHGDAATVLARSDHKATVVIRPRAAVRGSYERLRRGLTKRLKSRFADFEPVSEQVTPLGTGEGFVYAFARSNANRVQSVVVVPAGDRAYTLDVVAAGDEPTVAREVGAMVRSFQPAQVSAPPVE